MTAIVQFSHWRLNIATALITIATMRSTKWSRGRFALVSDSDGDGYGDDSSSVEACDAPSGTVDNSEDCDDDDADINPAAAETCDGIDNDCDGDVMAVPRRISVPGTSMPMAMDMGTTIQRSILRRLIWLCGVGR